MKEEGDLLSERTSDIIEAAFEIDMFIDCGGVTP